MSLVDVRAFAVRDGTPEPRGERIPSRLRRGSSLVVRTIADLYAELEPAFASKPVIVTGSAYGETSTALALITSELEDPPTVSPARFAASVHNTAAGLLGIATSNLAASTAIAAGTATFAMALLEAIATVRALRTEVALLVAEEPVPSAFGPAPPFSVTGIGLALAPAASGACIARLGEMVETADAGPTASTTLAPWYPAELVNALRVRRSLLCPLTQDGASTLAIHVESGVP